MTANLVPLGGTGTPNADTDTVRPLAVRPSPALLDLRDRLRTVKLSKLHPAYGKVQLRQIEADIYHPGVISLRSIQVSTTGWDLPTEYLGAIRSIEGNLGL